jgi:tetratricopeptide (TPR) repeat protein
MPPRVSAEVSKKKMSFIECRKLHFSFLLAVTLGLVSIFSTACSSEASKQKHLARGEEYLQKRKFQEAELEFRAAAEIDKTSPEAYWGLARAHENQGHVYETIDALRQVVQLSAQNLDAKVKLGNYYLVLTPPQTDEAQKLLKDIFAINQNFVEGHVLKASILTVQNKPEKEITDVLNHAIEIDPKRVESYISLARYFMQIRKGPEAEKAIQRAIAANDRSALGYLEYGRFFSFTQKPSPAEAQFKKAIELEPKNLEAREAIARFYLSERQLDKAEQAYKDIAQVLENSAEGRMMLADFYATVGREDEAIQVFQEILKDESSYARARYRLSEIYLGRKDYAKVNEQVGALLSINNSDAQALLLGARVKLQDNNAEEAVKDLEEILKKLPSHKGALFYMANARLSLGQIDQARAFIGDLEKYHPSYLYSKLLQIQASFAANESEKALSQANQLIEALKKSQPNIETTAQELEELRVRALSARGAAYLSLRKLTEARADFQEVQKLSSNSSSAYVNLARVSAAAGKGAEAISFYQKALSIDGKNFDALNGLISVLKDQKQFAQAHERLDKAIASADTPRMDLPALHYLKADVFQAEKNLAAAETEFQKSMAADENYLPAYSAYAALLVGQNQTERAIEQYKKIVEKKQSASVYTLLGMLEDARQNYDESEKAYRKALEVAPETPIAANNLAWNIAAFDKGNLDEALQMAQTNVNKVPGNASFYDTLGWVYFKKGLYSQAAEQLKKAVALDAADARRSGRAETPAYRLRLSQALARAGDKPNARREVEVALQNQKDLSESEVQDARNLLAGL